MDAANTEFPDATFDVVMVQYVLSAVSNPEATLDEFAGSSSRAGEIVLLSRVKRRGWRPPLHRGKGSHPLARRLGWRTDFSWALFARWAERPHGMQLIERRPDSAFRPFLADPIPQGRNGRLSRTARRSRSLTGSKVDKRIHVITITSHRRHRIAA